MEISTGDRTYAHHLIRFKDILDKAVDKPILAQYSGDPPLPIPPIGAQRARFFLWNQAEILADARKSPICD